MSELDQTVCWVPEGFDNRAVRKVQGWLNDHLGEQVIVCVRWRGLRVPPMWAQGPLELANVAAIEDVQGFGSELTDDTLAAVEELRGLYTVARTVVLDVGALAASNTHVRLSDVSVSFLIEPGDPRQDTVAISVVLADADETA